MGEGVCPLCESRGHLPKCSDCDLYRDFGDQEMNFGLLMDLRRRLEQGKEPVYRVGVNHA